MRIKFQFVAILAVVLVAFSYIAPPAMVATTEAAPAQFVSRCGTQFCLDGKPYYFAGANTYDLFTFGDGYSTATPNDIETKFIDKARIDAHFSNLEQSNVSVLRLWMFSHEQWHGFEPQRSVYSEPQWMLFDYIVQSAKTHNVKLLPVFENFWEAYGGIQTRLQWEGLGGDFGNRWRFFNRNECPGCFTQYKNYVSYALNRVNHYSGVAYKDDPAIFGWELMNEPRYQNATPNENSSGDTLRAWVDEMGAYVKGIDSNHLLGTGLEGHESRYGFGGDEGNPFIKIHQSPAIDFTSVHPYPTADWANLSIPQTRALIHTWITESHVNVGKPFFMGEFNTGAGRGDRSAWWQAIYDEIEASDGNGSAFWWYQDRQADGEFGVSVGAPELQIFSAHSARMRARNNGTTNPTPTQGNTPSPTPPGAATSTPAPSITPTATSVVDDLNDWSKAFAHSGALAFDTSNSQYFGGDTSHLNRTQLSAEWVTWRLAGMHQFDAVTYHWPYEAVGSFAFAASPDNVTFTAVTPSIRNVGGEWTRIEYMVIPPAGTQYLRVTFPTTTANSWNPQISRVSYSAGVNTVPSATPRPPTSTMTRAAATATRTATPTGTAAPTRTAGPSATRTVIPTAMRTTTSPTRTANPSPTRTAIPTNTRTAASSPTRTAIPTPTRTSSPTSAIRAQVRNAGSSTSDGEITPYMRLVNTGTTPVPLTSLTVRYWYTANGTQPETYTCFWARINCASITGRMVKLPTARAGADSYLELSFDAGAGTIAANASSGEMQQRVNKNDWSPYTETDDYSYRAAADTFTDWNHVTVYQKGTLVWGVEPR